MDVGRTVRVVGWSGALVCAASAWGQQGIPTPGSTGVQERVTGAILLAEGEPAVEVGDQIGAYAGEEVVGQTTITDAAAGEFEVLVFGDDPETPQVDGAQQEEVIRFRFFDISTDTLRTDVRLENASGEAVTYRYRGEEVEELPIDLPGLDLVPTRELDLRIGVEGDDGGGSGGDGGDGGSGLALDVDGDGRVTVEDAAQVLRLVAGASQAVDDGVASRADVNGDGLVNTRDAIEILRNR